MTPKFKIGEYVNVKGTHQVFIIDKVCDYGVSDHPIILYRLRNTRNPLSFRPDGLEYWEDEAKLSLNLQYMLPTSDITGHLTAPTMPLIAAPKFKIGDRVKILLKDKNFVIIDVCTYQSGKETLYTGDYKDFWHPESELVLYTPSPQEIVYEAWESSNGEIIIYKAGSKSSDLCQTNNWTRVPELDKKIVRKL